MALLSEDRDAVTTALGRLGIEVKTEQRQGEAILEWLRCQVKKHALNTAGAELEVLSKLARTPEEMEPLLQKILEKVVKNG